MPGPLDEMLRRIGTAQQDTLGGDLLNRFIADIDGAYGRDAGIYGKGRQLSSGWLGQPGSPVMPPQVEPWVMPWLRQSGIARNVVRDLERGADVNLTGSGLEDLSPSALDLLIRSLRQPQSYGETGPKPGIEPWR